MNVRQARPQPSVEIPSPCEDRPPWIKVGLIALAGFLIGVAWPRVVGVHLGPATPAEVAPVAPPAPPAPAAQPGRADANPVGTSLASAPIAPASASATPAVSPSPPEVPQVTVNRGVVLSCKTEEGEVKKGVGGCGAVAGFDVIAQPRLKKLAACPAALGANGKLSVVFNIDFPTNRIALEIGKSSTVANMDAFATCVKPAFQGVSIGAVDHQNPHYSLFYSLVFAPKSGAIVAGVAGGAVPAASGAPAPPSQAGVAATPSPAAAQADTDEGTAQVIWEVAIVRDTPRTGQVLARLQRGTKIHLGQGQDGWYRVKYGTDFSSEGWVYRGAIGR
jgi:hypothetical protein